MAKAGDNNAKLKSAANDALDLAAKHPLLGGIMVIERILLQKEDAHSQVDKSSILSTSTKHQAARLSVLASVIKETNLKENKIDVTRILKYAVSYLSSNNASIRM